MLARTAAGSVRARPHRETTGHHDVAVADLGICQRKFRCWDPLGMVRYDWIIRSSSHQPFGADLELVGGPLSRIRSKVAEQLADQAIRVGQGGQRSPAVLGVMLSVSRSIVMSRAAAPGRLAGRAATLIDRHAGTIGVILPREPVPDSYCDTASSHFTLVTLT